MSVTRVQSQSSALNGAKKEKDCCATICDALFGSCQKEKAPASPPALPTAKKIKVETGGMKTVRELVDDFKSKWNGTAFVGIEFDEQRFNKTVEKNNEQFPLSYNPQKEHGVIIKRDLKAGSEIYVRADLHGDLKCVLEDLKVLQEQGFLNSQYQCTNDVQLVFLGDYTDRGPHSMQVLELLMRLRMENPDQVTLIHGNHEDPQLNQMFASAHDPDFSNYLANAENHSVLKSFYNTLPLTIYLGHNKEYVHLTHGLFELYVDPYPMLQKEESSASMPVSKVKALSDRVKALKTPSSERIMFLWLQDLLRKSTIDLTIYNWGDIGPKTQLGLPEGRQWMLSLQDVKHYLNVAGAHFLIRGHQHVKEGHVDLTTLPVAMVTTPYHNQIDQSDCAYLLAVAPTVAEWSKRAIVRDRGQPNNQATITDPKPLSSTDI